MASKHRIRTFGPFEPAVRRMQATWGSWSRHNGGMMSAALAYYAICSLFPLVLLLISMLGLAQDQLLRIVSEETNEAVAEHLEKALSAVEGSAGVGGPVSGVLLLIVAMGMFVNMAAAFDHIFGMKAPSERGIWASVRLALFQRLRAFLMLSAVGFFVFMLLTGGLLTSALYRYAEGLEASYLWKILQMTATVLINWLLFTILYKFLPRVPITWHDASRGGALVTFLWEVSRHVLAVVLLGRKYSAYGIVGSLLALILWLYVCNAMILFGAEYVRALRDEREETSDETTKLKTPVEHKT